MQIVANAFTCRIVQMVYAERLLSTRVTDRSRGLLDVVDLLYEAALSPSRWTDALQGMATLLDARAAGVRIEAGGALRQEWVGLEPSFDRAYVEHYWRDDPWAEPVHRAALGMVGHGDAIVARAVVEKSAFYNELARPYGLDEVGGAMLERTTSRVVSFGAMKGLGHRFRDEDDRLLALLVPHLRRALTITERLQHTMPAPFEELAEQLTERLEQRLRRENGLTAAEATVAVCIGRGMSPKEIAVGRGTSWYTVRAQLRQILAKMECRSQSALAHAVTRLELRVAHDLARTSVRGGS